MKEELPHKKDGQGKYGDGNEKVREPNGLFQPGDGHPAGINHGGEPGEKGEDTHDLIDGIAFIPRAKIQEHPEEDEKMDEQKPKQGRAFFAARKWAPPLIQADGMRFTQRQ